MQKTFRITARTQLSLTFSSFGLSLRERYGDQLVDDSVMLNIAVGYNIPAFILRSVGALGCDVITENGTSHL